MQSQRTAPPDRTNRLRGATRLREQERDHRAVSAPLRRKGNVVVVDGFGVSLRVERGRLVIADGAGRGRRERTFSRSRHGIARLVVLSGEGSLSLASLRWCLDLGIPVLVFDRSGRILSVSGPTGADARLRRAQAFALTNSTGLEVARYLLAEKVRGQHGLLARLTDDCDLDETVAQAAHLIEEAGSLDELVMAERDAALAYWWAWRPLALRFQASDGERAPEHWFTFGQRGSPLSRSPHLAVNPANAMLNYLYALLEAETTIALRACGLDPGLGIVHADVRGRDSLALDAMEAVRPAVDSHALDLIESHLFHASDFYETRKGSCRILPPLTHTLGETAPTWGSMVAPIAEQLVAMLADAPGARIDRVPTPLTSRNRRQAHAHYRRPRAQPLPSVPCKLCGEPLGDRDRTYCDSCVALPQGERYASTLGIESAGAGTAAATPVPQVPAAKSRTSRGCKRCGGPVSHRKRVLCDPCFVAFRQELAAQRRPCKRCGHPVPHRKRVLCDACLAAPTSLRSTKAG